MITYYRSTRKQRSKVACSNGLERNAVQSLQRDILLIVLTIARRVYKQKRSVPPWAPVSVAGLEAFERFAAAATSMASATATTW
jgi:hypothetical protein